MEWLGFRYGVRQNRGRICSYFFKDVRFQVNDLNFFKFSFLVNLRLFIVFCYDYVQWYIEVVILRFVFLVIVFFFIFIVDCFF